MINANELRIGNLLIDPLTNSYLRVSELSDEGRIVTTVIDRSKFPLPDGWSAAPIPLSPEILEKAGFKGSESEYGGWVSPFVNDQAIRLRRNSEGVFYYSMSKYSNPIYIKSVHQLQNLFFALTGEELTLNL